MSEKAYDVFLSYNSEDRKAVEEVAVYLADKAGLRPWLDKWDLIPGEPTRASVTGTTGSGLPRLQLTGPGGCQSADPDGIPPPFPRGEKTMPRRGW